MLAENFAGRRLLTEMARMEYILQLASLKITDMWE